MKYDAKSKKISIGGFYDKSNSQFLKRNGIDLNLLYMPQAEINMHYQGV